MASIISFRYNAKPTHSSYSSRSGRPTARRSTFAAPPGSSTRTLLLLTPNYMGNLHGIKVVGLTPLEQRYIQEIVATAEMGGSYEVLQSNIQSFRAELAMLNQTRRDLLNEGRRVTVRPQGVIPQAAQIVRGIGQKAIGLGRRIGKSVFGTSTFGPTPVEQVSPASNIALQQELANNQNATALKQAQLDQWIKHLELEKSNFARTGGIARNPYPFYHQRLKPLIGSLRMPGIYRKFKVDRISTPRLISSPGMSYAGG